MSEHGDDLKTALFHIDKLTRERDEARLIAMNESLVLNRKLEELNANCISRFLHEQRMGDDEKWNYSPAPMPDQIWVYPFYENENKGQSKKLRWAISKDGPRSDAWKLFTITPEKKASSE